MSSYGQAQKAAQIGKNARGKPKPKPSTDKRQQGTAARTGRQASAPVEGRKPYHPTTPQQRQIAKQNKGLHGEGAKPKSQKSGTAPARPKPAAPARPKSKAPTKKASSSGKGKSRFSAADREWAAKQRASLKKQQTRAAGARVAAGQKREKAKKNVGVIGKLSRKFGKPIKRKATV